MAVQLCWDATQNHPQIFACLGMVVGLCGIVYLEVARTERGSARCGGSSREGAWSMVWPAHGGTWPVATVVLCLTNDLIWWIPFAIIYDSWHFYKRDLMSDKLWFVVLEYRNSNFRSTFIKTRVFW